MTYTVTVTDDETGEVVFTHAGLSTDHAEEYRDEETGAQLTPAELVLFQVAPDVCPWDCDHCRAD